MDSLCNIIYCCGKEESKLVEDNNKKNESEVFINIIEIKKEEEENQKLIEETPPQIIDVALSKKFNDNNNTLNTLYNTNNTSHLFPEENLINNLNRCNNNSNINNSIHDDNKNSSKISKDLQLPNKKRINYSNSISNHVLKVKPNINILESKKSSLKSRNISNRDSLITLSNLMLMNQEEVSTDVDSKLLLSGELFFYKKVILTTKGLKESLRKKKKDNHVFFGINNKADSYNDLPVNFIYKDKKSKLLEKEVWGIFEIYYSKKVKEYILNFLQPNLILYYKIQSFVYFNIDKLYYLILGNVFITIFVKKLTPLEKIINVKVEIEDCKPIKYSFNQFQAPIKIGRSNSDINIFNSSISKSHGIIEYSQNSQAFYYKDMDSTNGSTLIIKAKDILKLKGEMNFKLEDVSFKIQEIP